MGDVGAHSIKVFFIKCAIPENVHFAIHKKSGMQLNTYNGLQGVYLFYTVNFWCVKVGIISTVVMLQLRSGGQKGVPYFFQAVSGILELYALSHSASFHMHTYSS